MNRSPFLTAIFHPINLAMLALVAAAGLCSAWWLAPVGFVLWLVMVAVIARDPGLKMTFTRQNRQPLAPRYQARFDRLDRARVSIFNTVSRNHAPAFQKAIEPLQTALDGLVEHAYQISLRLSALDNNLSIQQLTNNFDGDLAKIQKELDATSEPAARKEFEATLQSLKLRQEQLKTVSGLLARFEAQLTGTNNAVDSVVTNVAGFQGRSPKQVAEKTPALIQILQTEESELNDFDSQLEKTSLL